MNKKNLVRIALGTGIALFAAFIYFTPIHAQTGNISDLCQRMYSEICDYPICEEGHMNCIEMHQKKTSTNTNTSYAGNTENTRLHKNCNGTHDTQQKEHHQQGHHRGYHHS